MESVDIKADQAADETLVEVDALQQAKNVDNSTVLTDQNNNEKEQTDKKYPKYEIRDESDVHYEELVASPPISTDQCKEEAHETPSKVYPVTKPTPEIHPIHDIPINNPILLPIPANVPDSLRQYWVIPNDVSEDLKKYASLQKEISILAAKYPFPWMFNIMNNDKTMIQNLFYEKIPLEVQRLMYPMAPSFNHINMVPPPYPPIPNVLYHPNQIPYQMPNQIPNFPRNQISNFKPNPHPIPPDVIYPHQNIPINNDTIMNLKPSNIKLSDSKPSKINLKPTEFNPFKKRKIDNNSPQVGKTLLEQTEVVTDIESPERSPLVNSDDTVFGSKSLDYKTSIRHDVSGRLKGLKINNATNIGTSISNILRQEFNNLRRGSTFKDYLDAIILLRVYYGLEEQLLLNITIKKKESIGRCFYCNSKLFTINTIDSTPNDLVMTEFEAHHECDLRDIEKYSKYLVKDGKMSELIKTKNRTLKTNPKISIQHFIRIYLLLSKTRELNIDKTIGTLYSTLKMGNPSISRSRFLLVTNDLLQIFTCFDDSEVVELLYKDEIFTKDQLLNYEKEHCSKITDCIMKIDKQYAIRTTSRINKK